MKQALVLGLALMALTGCHSYSWKPKVPEDMRTVAVPTFRNESDVVELGSVMARQLLREFQREGTFAVRPAGEAALEIQGVIAKAEAGRLDYRRENASRSFESEMRVGAKVSVVDRRNGKVLIDEPRQGEARAREARNRLRALPRRQGDAGSLPRFDQGFQQARPDGASLCHGEDRDVS